MFPPKPKRAAVACGEWRGCAKAWALSLIHILIAHALGVIAKARGMTQLARDTGLSRESLYKALSGEGNPEFATVMKVVKALGFQLHASPVA